MLAGLPRPGPCQLCGAGAGVAAHLALTSPGVVGSDPLVSARHARVRRQDDGRWVLENNKSVNGVWLRVEQISFKGTCRFMLGEQRFVIHAPE